VGRQLRVCQLLQGLDVGGIERVVVDLCRRLDRRRFEPIVCCYDRLGDLAGALASQDVPVALERRGPGLDWGFPMRLARRLRALRVDVLHAHNQTAFFYGVPAARLAGVGRIVFTEHDRIAPPRPALAAVHRTLARLTSQICAVSSAVRRRLARFDGIALDRITVVFNGVDGSRFDPHSDGAAMRAELGVAGRPTLGIIGRLSPEKNHVLAFAALARVARRFPDAVLLVVGDGPLSAVLPERASDVGVADRVRFLGAREDVPRLMSAMDVVVLCSTMEGLPLVPIEAMAAGRAVVVTDVGGCREAVVDGETGGVVASGDTDALAGQIERLLGDPALRARLGAAGRARFERLFSLDRMVRAYEAAYTAGPVHAFVDGKRGVRHG